MSALTFDFPYHRVRDEYPEGTTVQMGKGWVFPIKPDSPDQRTFILSFVGMQYFLNGSGVVDATINPTRNVKALSDFYAQHQQWDTFTYPHPVHGNLTCRFKSALKLANGIIDGNGVMEPFEVILIEVPA